MKTMKTSKSLVIFAVAISLLAAACDSDTSPPQTTGGASAAEAAPAFSLAWSEYPSWSVFGVAELKGIINGKAGQLGTVEKTHGVDIVLNQLDYDPCLTAYASREVDAVCITNMDALIPAEEIPSVAILPTSTSIGADACIVVGIDSVDQLKGVDVYGLEKTVSEYCFVRNLQKLGFDPADFKFTNKDPGAAALAMQIKDSGTRAIMVWNPFVLQTLKLRPEAKVLFDSSAIPGEIIDMVVVSQAALDRPGGDKFARAVIDAFYQVNDAIAQPDTSSDTLVALGAKFSNLGLDEMKEVVKQTVFYKTPTEALALFEGSDVQSVMQTVVGFCVDRQVVSYQPNVAYGADQAAGQHVRFDPTYIKAIQAQRVR